RVIECHNLSVDDGIGQVGRSLGNSAELAGPVEAFAREHRRGAILDVELHAVAIELDLVNPVVALRRPGKGLAELRMDEARHGAQQATRVAVLFNPLDRSNVLTLNDMQKSAPALGLTIQPVETHTPA